MGDANSLVNIVDAGYSGSVWIGLKRATQKHWGWSHGEDTLAQYSAWNGGGPNSQKECAYLAFGVWHTYQCTSAFHFVCHDESTGYIKVDLWKNWSDAQSYCRQYYTDLVTIRNSQEHEQLKIVVPSTTWVWIGLFLDSIYQYMNESMTWLDAQSYCRARFTDLATADSMNDVNRLVTTVDSGYNGSVWIGLHAGTEYHWVWSLGEGTISNYSMWSPGEPNGDGDCVRCYNGSWYDEICSTVLPFVCFNGDYCRQHHTDLASISSPEQQNLIPSELSLWIGLHLDSWQWSDHWNLRFRHWAADQLFLSLGSGDCVGMSGNNGKWAQYSCDLQQPFICYG
ncbi:hypothetical protein M9458_004838, partial [Cirrhinus mrigala]